MHPLEKDFELSQSKRICIKSRRLSINQLLLDDDIWMSTVSLITSFVRRHATHFAMCDILLYTFYTVIKRCLTIKFIPEN